MDIHKIQNNGIDVYAHVCFYYINTLRTDEVIVRKIVTSAS